MSADKQEGLQTPREWERIYRMGRTVMDPDGWRGNHGLPAKSFDEPITWEEYRERSTLSTCSYDPDHLKGLGNG